MKDATFMSSESWKEGKNDKVFKGTVAEISPNLAKKKKSPTNLQIQEAKQTTNRIKPKNPHQDTS